MSRKLNYLTVAILASFLATKSFAEEFNFETEDNYANTATVSGEQNQTSYQNSNNTQNNGTSTSGTSIAPPSAPITQLPVVPKEVRENAQRLAFDKASKYKQGLTPDMIRELKKGYQDKKAAANETTNVAVSESRTASISLGVSDQKEVIRTTSKFATSISLVDSTGKPWNVENVVIGNKDDFEVVRLDGPNGYLFSLTAKKDGSRSNIIFILQEGKSTKVKIPLVLDVVSGQKQADAKLILRAQGIGPNGSIEQTKLTQAIDSKYNSWLDGVIPSSAKKIKTDNKFAKAWIESDGSIVVITKYVVFSPNNANVSLASPEGDATLYKFAKNDSVLWGKDPSTGEIVKIKITGF